MIRKKVLAMLVMLAVVLGFNVLPADAGEKNPCGKNPCAVKNPCAKNPCSAKNPCAKNPCAMKPKPVRANAVTDKAKLMEMGTKLWSDAKLGKSGASCATCHPDGKGLKKTAFPKYVKMPNDIVTLDQMINFCMLNPMKAKPLAWNAVELTALAAYAQANAKEDGEIMQPCGMKHPCGMKNPCGKKNPCAMKNPCGKK